MKKGRFDWAGGPDGEGGRDRELNRQVLLYNPWSKGRSWPEFYHTRGGLNRKKALATLAKGLGISISQFLNPLASFFPAKSLSLQNLRKLLFTRIINIKCTF